MILKLIFLVCCMSFFCRSQAQQISLFDEETVLDITLSGDLDKLFKDRVGEATYLNLHLRYRDERGELVEIPIKSKTRGNFRRRKNVCTYPPLLLNFSKSTSSNSIFHQQDKVKLVMPCKMDKYVIREYYAYKLFNLISEKSFKVRLVRITLEDSSGKMKQEGPFYAFLIEEEEQLAKRNGIEVLKKDFLRPELVIKEDFLAMAVFQYLIGNTDWSVQYRQNIKLFSDQYQENIVAVPYDFDHAGIVSAPYAKPAEALKLSSVLERRYRGYCIQDMEKFEHVFTIFNERKDDIYELYTGSPYLEKSYINSTLKYLNAFYRTINSPRLAKVEFTYPCDPEGTGHVVIKGLREIEDQD
ncbi:hypothetical protein [Cecembia rubra]|nr:hypothetical protein [Cecembia rubra]